MHGKYPKQFLNSITRNTSDASARSAAAGDFVRCVMGFWILVKTALSKCCCSVHAQVIQRANDTEYGLAAAVFSKNVDTINSLSRALRAGTIW